MSLSNSFGPVHSTRIPIRHSNRSLLIPAFAYVHGKLRGLKENSMPLLPVFSADEISVCIRLFPLNEVPN